MKTIIIIAVFSAGVAASHFAPILYKKTKDYIGRKFFGVGIE